MATLVSVQEGKPFGAIETRELVIKDDGTILSQGSELLKVIVTDDLCKATKENSAKDGKIVLIVSDVTTGSQYTLEFKTKFSY